jgi:hypothetical protein
MVSLPPGARPETDPRRCVNGQELAEAVIVEIVAASPILTNTTRESSPSCLLDARITNFLYEVWG